MKDISPEEFMLKWIAKNMKTISDDPTTKKALLDLVTVCKLRFPEMSEFVQTEIKKEIRKKKRLQFEEEYEFDTLKEMLEKYIRDQNMYNNYWIK